MFKLPDQKWLEKQPKHTQEWLKKQAVWHDGDLITAALVGFLVGVALCQLL